MPFDGVLTTVLVKELNDSLKGGRINKIYQPRPDELFIQISSGREKHTLFISSNSTNPRVYITDEKSQNPVNPPSFCMLLRKHLLNGRLKEITQHGSDRIMEFHIISKSELAVEEPKRLIIEIMGKHSNIILVDDNSGMILDSIKRVSIDMSRERQILPKMMYTYPPAQNKIPIAEVDENDFDMDNIQGLSKAFKTELKNADDPYVEFRKMTGMIEDSVTDPVVYFDDSGKPAAFYILPLTEYNGAKTRSFDSVSDMLSYYYSKKESSNRMNQKSADLRKVIGKNLDKLNLKKQRLLEDLEKTKNGETYKLCGELITSNIHDIKRGQRSVSLYDYYSEKTKTITLDPLLSPSENAQKYYKKYNKSKVAKEEKTVQLQDTDENIQVLESYYTYIDNADTPEVIDDIRTELTDQGYLRKRKKQSEQKKKKRSWLKVDVPGGFSVCIGRNNSENDELTMKRATGGDIWFHTKDIPGSHVILFTEGRDPDEKTILETASIAAYYSKARHSQNVPVDYTKIKNIKKVPGAKPGMVIFKNNKTVYVEPKNPDKGNDLQ